MRASLVRLAPREDASLDTARILVLRQSLGAERCREVIEEVVFHITERLTLLEKALEAGDGAEAARLAGRVAVLADQVGLATFSRVARELAGCLDRGDPTASAAVAARLIRLGEDSLLSVVLYADQMAL